MYVLLRQPAFALVQHPKGIGDPETARIIEFFQAHPGVMVILVRIGSVQEKELRSVSEQTGKGTLVVVLEYSMIGKSQYVTSAINPSDEVLAQYLRDYFEGGM